MPWFPYDGFLYPIVCFKQFCAKLISLIHYRYPGIHPDMSSQQIVDTLKLALMIGDVRLTEEKEGVAGDAYVLDAAVLGPSMLTKLSATTIKKFMICVQVCPYRYKKA